MPSWTDDQLGPGSGTAPVVQHLTAPARRTVDVPAGVLAAEEPEPPRRVASPSHAPPVLDGRPEPEWRCPCGALLPDDRHPIANAMIAAYRAGLAAMRESPA